MSDARKVPVFVINVTSKASNPSFAPIEQKPVSNQAHSFLDDAARRRRVLIEGAPEPKRSRWRWMMLLLVFIMFVAAGAAAYFGAFQP